jgi:hypothetical protein
MRPSIAIAFACMLAGLSSCERPAATEGRRMAIEANLKSLRQVPGHVTLDGGHDVQFTAYFQMMDLQYIEVTPLAGSAVRDHYYFHKDELFCYRRMNGEKLERQFVIDRKGAMIRTTPSPYPESEAGGEKVHAEELKKIATARAGHMFTFPLMKNR